jgi:metallophosphoesterase (TIGR00282 family)
MSLEKKESLNTLPKFMLKVLFFGDIVGEIGQKAILKILPFLKKKYQPDLILANGENLPHDLIKKRLLKLKNKGINFFTLGNHLFPREIFDDEEIKEILIKPANFKEEIGNGYKVLNVDNKNLILVINLLGRTFIDENIKSPFEKLDEILKLFEGKKLSAILVDFHAEATSEKNAFGWWADGKVSAVLGTHTHIGTIDFKILPKGTAYITDVGMVGAKNSVIGAKKESSLRLFLNQASDSFKIEFFKKGEAIINGVYLEINPKTKKAKKIERVDYQTKV